MLNRVGGIGVAFAVLAHLCAAARADERHSFIIPPSDGYGIADCLIQGGSCGRVVADSWCEAHGLSAAVAFGRAEDVTSAVDHDHSPLPAIPAGSLIINCAE